VLNKENNYGKVLSLATLVLVTGAFGFLFFEVTSTLCLPLFLAMVSVVMFRPFHTWCARLLRGRNRVAALISMTAVLLLVIATTAVVRNIANRPPEELRD
jgi:predicted PurR-regulated permease PerM